MQCTRGKVGRRDAPPLFYNSAERAAIAAARYWNFVIAYIIRLVGERVYIAIPTFFIGARRESDCPVVI